MTEGPLSQVLRRHGITEPPFEVIPTVSAVRVSGEGAVSLWQALRAIVPVTHRWPVMIDLAESFERRAPRSSAEECLELAEAAYREIVEWAANPRPRRPDVGAALVPLVGRGSRPLAELAQSLARAPMLVVATEQEAPPSVLDHPPDDAPSVLQIPNAPTTLAIALVPTELGWQVPAYLPIAWECVTDCDAVSSLRRLDELFGVELVGMTRELIELRVARPPADERSARIMSKLLLGPDEGSDVKTVLRAGWLSLWWD